MGALTGDRAVREREGKKFVDPVAADAVIFGGALVVLDAAGFAEPASTAVGLLARGIAQEAVDNTGGSNGDAVVEVKKGVFPFLNEGGDPVALADVESVVYIVDDQTIAKTDGSSSRSVAGKLVAFENDIPWVEIS